MFFLFYFLFLPTSPWSLFKIINRWQCNLLNMCFQTQNGNLLSEYIEMNAPVQFHCMCSRWGKKKNQGHTILCYIYWDVHRAYSFMSGSANLLLCTLKYEMVPYKLSRNTCSSFISLHKQQVRKKERERERERNVIVIHSSQKHCIYTHLPKAK